MRQPRVSFWRASFFNDVSAVFWLSGHSSRLTRTKAPKFLHPERVIAPEQPAKQKPFATLEKSAADYILQKKARPGTTGQRHWGAFMMRESVLGFDRGMSSMSSEPLVSSASGRIMQVTRFQPAHPHVRGFTLGVAVGDEFELRRPYETGFEHRKIRRSAEPFSVPQDFGRDNESIDIFKHRATAFESQFRRHPLIGVEVKNPRVAEGNLTLRVVALAREIIKRSCEDTRPGCACDFHGPIARSGIENHHVVAIRHRSQAIRKVTIRVERENYHGEAVGRWGGGGGIQRLLSAKHSRAVARWQSRRRRADEGQAAIVKNWIPATYAQTDRAISDDFPAENSFSTNNSPKSSAVPAPRDVSNRPSATTRSSARMCANSFATEKCAV
jgi:hypothetical protein